ncbi:MAG: GNAT family N-acetyltransferase [Thermoplasmata archaeon]
MRIVSYDETDREDVLAMNIVAFGWPLTEELVRKHLKHDSRWMENVGVFAVERCRTVAQVITLRIPTRTTEGLETVGGIAGVTVVPGVARRGIATALMEAAHDVYRENDIRISFLLTGESLVAFHLYRKLGYLDVAPLTFAQKLIRMSGKPRGLKLRVYRRKDWRTTDELHSRAVRRLMGFVVRQPAFLNIKMDTAAGPFGRKNIYLAEAKDPEGYAIKSERAGNVHIREIVCPAQRSFDRVMALIESDAVGKCVFADVLTPKLLQDRFEKRGYRIIRKSWWRIMVAPLVGNVSRRKLYKLYDFGGRFCIMGQDTF